MTIPGPKHAAPTRRPARSALWVAVGVFLAALVIAPIVGSAIALTRSAPPGDAVGASARPTPPPVASITSPTPSHTPMLVAACELPGVAAALEQGDDDAVIAAMGGADAMRTAVAAGKAPCIDLADPARVWVVVDKARPFDPIDYWPGDLGAVSNVRSLSGGWLRAESGAAMTKLVAAAREAGVGEIAMESAFRSYSTQVTSYGNQLATRGREGADKVSARPGHSEHQSGLAADVVACDGGCGSLDALASTPQGEWLAANAWRYGFVVRYEACCTGTTGFLPEPWHLRYIGVPLAEAYHDGGFHALEDFWGLPPAPDYVD